MRVPKLERQLGMEVYASKTPGIEGRIRLFPEDFVVEEILKDGSCAAVSALETPTPTPAGEGKHLVCLLIKRDWDNLLAVKRIAKLLGISPKRVHIAGIKDARALTAQHVSIKDVSPKRVLRLKLKDVALRPLRYSKERISAFQLYGNRFTVVIRKIPHSSAEAARRIQSIRQELETLGGMPNFFGHQRFGTVRPITHLVGKALAQGDVERAVMIYLAEASRFEHPGAREAREQLREKRDFQEALRRFPRHLRFEVSMLRQLAQKPEDYMGAFRKLPSRLRRLFLQAYQSYLFNRFLSERVRRGLPLDEPQVGDYVVILDGHGLPTERGLRVESKNLGDVQRAVRSGKMRVAIPLVGYRQPPSAGVQGEIEEEILGKEGVTPQSFYVASMPELGAPGSLRTASTPIMDLSLNKPGEDKENPSKRKVRCSFTLLRGCYATVFLRELMKPRNILEAGF